MNREQMIAWETQYESGVYTKQPIMLVRGEGARVWDADGTEYIDCVGGHGASNLGHAHPAVVAAVTAQAQRMFLSPNGFYNDQRAELLKELVRIAPQGIERAFLCNSGTEAVEAALKFARLATKRVKLVSTMRAFHGRTMGALSMTWNKDYRQPFEPLIPDVAFVPYGKLDRLAKVVDDQTAGVILEVVQGEGGVNPGDGDYLQAVQAMCRERGALFIVDEVQTGFGRTGKLFASEHYDLHPDLMCVAKSIAGGLPMGATLIGARVGEIPKKTHGNTFGGNPLTCAAALATIHTLESEHLPERAAKLGTRLITGFASINSSIIREVRGLGLMVGIELKTQSGQYLAALAEQGVLALPAGGTVMRFLPPLVISEADIETVIEKVTSVLTVMD
ncbi:MAG: aspartate aminotransferase family protein [Anaerolineae bacterium]|nr:aspartate aminotransferase family protein [Anaerolineae bacterium]